MKWASYNKKGKLTLFGLPSWAEMALLLVLGSPLGFLGFSLPGCADVDQQSAGPPPLPPSKYRVVQVYGSTRGYTDFTAYATDDVKYDGPWIKFFDKNRRMWTRLSGTILVEGGEN